MKLNMQDTKQKAHQNTGKQKVKDQKSIKMRTKEGQQMRMKNRRAIIGK